MSFTYNGSNVRVGLAPQVPGQSSGRGPGSWRGSARGSRSGWSWPRSAAPPRRSRPRGRGVVRVGDPEFDRGFVVQANDAEMARSFLSAGGPRGGRRTSSGWRRPAGMLVSINPERLLVQVDRNLAAQAESLLFAVHEALIVHDGLQPGVASRLSQGIAIVETGPADPEDAGPPVCKVCGEPIVEPEVVCTTCRTPHHRDCWEFIGSCSIYGCNGKHSRPA